MQRRFAKAIDSAITTSSRNHVTAPFEKRTLQDISRLLYEKDVHDMLHLLSYLSPVMSCVIDKKHVTSVMQRVTFRSLTHLRKQEHVELS